MVSERTKSTVLCFFFFFFFFKILLLSQDKEQRLPVPLCSTRYCRVASLNKVLGAVMGCSFMVLEETLLLSYWPKETRPYFKLYTQ